MQIYDRIQCKIIGVIVTLPLKCTEQLCATKKSTIVGHRKGLQQGKALLSNGP